MSGCYLQTKTRWKNLNKQLIIFIKLREFLFWRFKKHFKFSKLQIQNKYIYIKKKYLCNCTHNSKRKLGGLDQNYSPWDTLWPHPFHYRHSVRIWSRLRREEFRPLCYGCILVEQRAAFGLSRIWQLGHWEVNRWRTVLLKKKRK